MSLIWAEHGLLKTGWQQNILIEIDEVGIIQSVEPDQTKQGKAVGIILPAPVNVHSHAFQRAMAGLTERKGPNVNDSFWTWRQLMFRFLDRLTPEHIEAITAFVQMEMLEAGYATNVEFHYLHHQAGGVPYDNVSEMSDRIMAATKQTGIGLTLLPVHYQFGGCDQRELGAGQIRFGNDPERFAHLVEAVKPSLKHLPDDTRLGVAPHSLRAVSRESLRDTASLVPGGPIHMHLAEQTAEVEEVQEAWGARPVEWLLANNDIDERWCLIHCTQMKSDETISLAKSGAIAGLCPITEASLGDGIFDGVRWFENNGRIAIGSDSNIRISLIEELRSLEYSQRLRDHSRAALATSNFSTGRRIFDAVCAGGAQAAGRNCGSIEVGKYADLLALDGNSVNFASRTGDMLLDSFIFSSGDNVITDVWSAGRHVVTNGKHIRHDRIVENYGKTLRALGDAV